jgi:tight adherence protein B
MAGCGGAGAVVAWAVVGGVVAPFAAGLVASTGPILVERGRRERRMAVAREAWPRLIEELRLKASTAGRSLPQALFDAATSAPMELRHAFERARREWLLSTDFERTLALLRDELRDPTADVVCETLLVAQQVGGGEVDRVLAALVEDRIADLHGRKDAVSRQAGARFARSFTLVVPAGMALVGMSMGQGRQAYAGSMGQALVVAAIGLTVACWWWAGRIMKLPGEDRVFLGASP